MSMYLLVLNVKTKEVVVLDFVSITNSNLSQDQICVFLVIHVKHNLLRYLKLRKNLIIGVCYRPPNQNVNDFNDKLHTALNLIDKERKDCVILGDFDIDLKKVDICNPVSEFLETFVSHSFEPLIRNPTRISDTSSSLIDSIFVNSNCDILSGTILSDVSDHLPVFSLLNYPFTSKDENTNYVTKRIINEPNINLFLGKFNEVNFRTLFS